MNVDGVHRVPYDRLRGTGINLHVWLADCFQYGPGIKGSLIKGRIPVYSGDA
jgi:hypothetical protein